MKKATGARGTTKRSKTSKATHTTDGSITQVQAALTPYLRQRFLRGAYIESDKVSRACKTLRKQYTNVDAAPRPGDDGRTYLLVRVRGFLRGGSLVYEIRSSEPA